MDNVPTLPRRSFLRHHVETAIESLIALLDVLDGDPDLEITAHETDPYCPDDQRNWSRTSRMPDDCEDVCDCEAAS
jgi:hypothetical protein